MPAVPVIRDAASAPFYEGTARGELLLRRCEDCALLSAPRIETCPSCGSARLGWKPAQGTGILVSWTVVHGRISDSEPTRTVAGLVELTEGPWLHARIVGIAPENVTAQLPLVVDFDHSDESETVPVFRPATQTGTTA